MCYWVMNQNADEYYSRSHHILEITPAMALQWNKAKYANRCARWIIEPLRDEPTDQQTNERVD